jgi:hypothetical protein
MLGKIGMLSATLLCAAACSNGVTVQNQNPKGTVGGLILDGATLMPVTGVAVEIISGGGSFTAMTDATGIFKVTNVPSGTLIVEISKSMYVSARLDAALGGSVGNFPIGSPVTTLPPIGLIPVRADFAVRVVDTNGAPVTGVSGIARTDLSYLDLSSNTPIGNGITSANAKTAADGRLVFKGLPDAAAVGVDANVAISIAPIEVTGQDDYQYAGGIFDFELLTLGTSVPQITLFGPNDALLVLASNAEWLRTGFQLPSPATPVNGSLIGAMGPITVSFSEAIDSSTVRAQLSTENGGAGPMLTPTVNLNQLSLVPTTALNAGQRYNLKLYAQTSLSPGLPDRSVDLSAPFFASPAAGSSVTMVSAVLTGNTIQFTLSEPIGLGNGVGQGFPCAVFYEGVNFDGSAAGQPLVDGEWSTNPSSLSCATASPVTSPVPNAPAFDNGNISGEENNGNLMAQHETGFATYFSTSFAAYTTGTAPAVAMPGSNVPVSGTKGHLYFPTVASSVHRANGQPVTQIDFTIQ